MRILAVTHNYPRAPGDAAGSFIHRLNTALVDAGHQVRVLTPSGIGLPLHVSVDGVEIVRYRYAPDRWETLAHTGRMAEEVSGALAGKLALGGLLIAGRRHLAEHVRTWAPDVVHAHWWFPSGMIATMPSPIIPVVTTMHGSDVRLARGLMQQVFRSVLRRSATATAVSQWLCEAAEAASNRSVALAPMPANTELFTFSDAPRQRRLLFVGRLTEQKGVRTLLEAFAMLPADVELDVVGEGELREHLQSRASERGIAARITWHGQLSQPELPALYHRAAALVVPSVAEGFGLVAVEGQLCGTVVIASKSGGLVDIVRDGDTGYLVPPGDANALAARIEEALANPVHRLELARRAAQNALSRYSPQACALRYSELYSAAATHG